MMPSIAFRNICSPLFLFDCKDFVCSNSSVSRSVADVWVLVSGCIEGEGIASKLWKQQ